MVVPTRDRPGALERCLTALARQTASALEVIVVDDGSRDVEAVAAQAARFAARLVRREGRGPSHARNAGVGAAEGEIVLFTDDDCEPSESWAERLVERIDLGAEAVAGRTVAASRSSPLARASQLIADSLVRPGERAQLSFAPSNNLGCRVGIARELPFPGGYARPGGEDRDWCARLLARGYRLEYEPEAVVCHRQELTFARFWRQQVSYGRGAARFRRAHAAGFESPGFYWGLLRRGFSGGVAVGVLVLLAQIATAVGIATETVHRRAVRR